MLALKVVHEIIIRLLLAFGEFFVVETLKLLSPSYIGLLPGQGLLNRSCQIGLFGFDAVAFRMCKGIMQIDRIGIDVFLEKLVQSESNFCRSDALSLVVSDSFAVEGFPVSDPLEQPVNAHHDSHGKCKKLTICIFMHKNPF